MGPSSSSSSSLASKSRSSSTSSYLRLDLIHPRFARSLTRSPLIEFGIGGGGGGDSKEGDKHRTGGRSSGLLLLLRLRRRDAGHSLAHSMARSVARLSSSGHGDHIHPRRTTQLARTTNGQNNLSCLHTAAAAAAAPQANIVCTCARARLKWTTAMAQRRLQERSGDWRPKQSPGQSTTRRS